MTKTKQEEIWKVKTKHNKSKKFETPQELLTIAYNYFEWCDKNVWYKQKLIKSGSECGKIINVPIKRPLFYERTMYILRM